MEMTTMAATMPPTTAPVFELLPLESDEDPVKDALGEVVDTPEGPKIAPGPYSGVSMSNVGEIVMEGERKDRHDAHHQLDALRRCPRNSLSGVYCEYVAIEENLETNRDIESSPVRDIYTRRDRVWEPGDQFQCQIQ
jgi:hypothetical protein